MDPDLRREWSSERALQQLRQLRGARTLIPAASRLRIAMCFSEPRRSPGRGTETAVPGRGMARAPACPALGPAPLTSAVHRCAAADSLALEVGADGAGRGAHCGTSSGKRRGTEHLERRRLDARDRARVEHLREVLLSRVRDSSTPAGTGAVALAAIAPVLRLGPRVERHNQTNRHGIQAKSSYARGRQPRGGVPPNSCCCLDLRGALKGSGRRQALLDRKPVRGRP